MCLLFLTPPEGVAAQATKNYAVYLPIVTRAVTGWFAMLNHLRAQAGLPALTENALMSQGCFDHARYMVKNDVIEHSEDPGNPWYTPAGLEAARASDLMVETSVTATDFDAFDKWMTAPFHAVALLDPQLLQVGFGSFREADAATGGFEMGAAVDVMHGLGALPSTLRFPIFWPGNGSSVPYARASFEDPDPLTGCPGYNLPVGLPLIVQFGAGEQSPVVYGHSLKRGVTSLEHCVFTESTYTNPSPDRQKDARAILDQRDAVVIVPRAPLTVGQTYTASLNTNLGTYTWSFTVSGDE